MTKINFYHLTTTPMGKALPKLLEKVISGGNRVVVKAPDDVQVEQLNKELWTYTTKFFLPHGSAEDGFEKDQPIYLTANNNNPNGANIFAFINDTEVDNIGGFERYIYMFDGNDESQVAIARKRWKEYKSAECDLTYWKQNKKGGWEQGES